MKVINLEPFGYSVKAKEDWLRMGWSYQEKGWSEVLETTYESVEAIIVRLSRKIGAKELSAFPNLKYVLSATTGWDHLDLEALKNRGVQLISLRGEEEFLKTIPSTAEHTWALLMGLIRKIPQSHADVKNGGWNRDRFRGYQLKDKTLGIVGLGRTGSKVATYAEAFGMKVIYYDPNVKSQDYEKLDSLDGLLKESDIVTFHIHLNEKTEHLINKKNITSVKEGVYLINTSRGKIWDESAIVDFLSTGEKEGPISGIAVDVLSTELDDLKKSALWQISHDESVNVIITPHIGGATWDAMWSCEEFLVKKMK